LEKNEYAVLAMAKKKQKKGISEKVQQKKEEAKLRELNNPFENKRAPTAKFQVYGRKVKTTQPSKHRVVSIQLCMQLHPLKLVKDVKQLELEERLEKNNKFVDDRIQSIETPLFHKLIQVCCFV
jgi:hypothetical protein